MNKLKTLWYLNRYFGPGWLAYRLGYAARARLGLLRRQMPARIWEEQPLASLLIDPRLAVPQAYLARRKVGTPTFFFTPEDRPIYKLYFDRWDGDTPGPLREAGDLAQGNFTFFRYAVAHTGFPPDWRCNPFTGQSYPGDRHWSQIGEFGHGDIKVIWDLNRFGFVYALVRAYWRTGDERYPELFWRLVEDWRMQNPPQLGVNWKCGQETSLRMMAWCFGLYGFLDSPATTPERACMLGQLIGISARRVEANLSHALSQQNNHGVSEGMGLWTAGLLFPELSGASRWLEKGQKVLERLGRELIYTDGAFCQHSTNYQRLALHDYIWSIRLGELNGRRFSHELVERVKKAGELLYQLQDEASGRVPCFGHNDGSLILPLDNCDYQDYRPVIQASRWLTTGRRFYQTGPWDEGLLWLFGIQALQPEAKPSVRIAMNAVNSGCYTLRSKAGFAFIHCASFHHRPAHADLLNVDIWWQGQNITLDAGSYSYNAPEPWDHSLAKAYCHNAVTVDGIEPMEPVSRFLWLPWIKGIVDPSPRSADDLLACWAGSHDGYSRLKNPVSYHRWVMQLRAEHWLVIDRLESAAVHSYRLGWLFPDLPYSWDEDEGELCLDTPAGKYRVTMLTSEKPVYSLVRADPGSPRGWRSPYYFSREPALSLDCTTQAKSLTIWTIFRPDTSEK